MSPPKNAQGFVEMVFTADGSGGLINPGHFVPKPPGIFFYQALQSNGQYVESDGLNSNRWTQVCTTPLASSGPMTLTATERIARARIQVWARSTFPPGGNAIAALVAVDPRPPGTIDPGVSTNSGGYITPPLFMATPNLDATIRQFAGGWWYTQDGGAEWTAAAINALTLYLATVEVAGIHSMIFDVIMEVDARAQCAAVVTAPAEGSGVADLSPVITWSYLPNGLIPYPGTQTQTKYEAKLWTKAAYQSGGVGAAALDETGIVLGPDTQWYMNAILTPGTDYVVGVRVAKDFNGTDWWSGWDTNTFRVASGPKGTPSSPTGNTQLDGSQSQVFSWGFAPDVSGDTQAGYEIQYKRRTDTVWISTGDQSSSTHSHTFGAGYFGSGEYEWQVRVRGNIVPDYGGWSSSAFFKVNQAPSAPTPVRPTQAVAMNVAITFEWVFVDADPGGSQSAAHLRWRKVGASTWNDVLIGGSVTQYSLGAGTISTEGQYEWQVQVNDDTGATSPWSAVTQFLAFAAPVVSIGSPSNGATLTSRDLTVGWSVSGNQQEAFQIRRMGDASGSADPNVIYYDSGIQLGSNLTFHIQFDTNNRYEHVQVRSRRQGVWSGWADARVQIAFTPAPKPTISVIPDNTNGYMLITCTNPSAGGGEAPAVKNELWRIDVRKYALGDPASVTKVADSLALNFTYADYAVGSTRPYLYFARAVTANGGIRDSDITPTA